MKIEFVEIANFRRLESVRIDFSPNTTLLVGPNNSGKSSAIVALQRFLHGEKFKLTDFTLQNLPRIVEAGKKWVELTESDEVPVESAISDLSPILPTLDVWFSADETELARVPVAVPLLQDYPGGFGVRLRLEPRDSARFKQEYVSKFSDAEKMRLVGEGVQLHPADLVQYLEAQVATDFEIRGYLLDVEAIEGPTPFQTLSDEDSRLRAKSLNPQMQRLTESHPPFPHRLIRRLIKIDMISATRGVSDADAEGTSGRLSGISGTYYLEHLQPKGDLAATDLAAIRTEQAAIVESNRMAQEIFAETLTEIRGMGYPGGGDPGLIFESDLSFGLPKRQMFLRHQIGADSSTPRSLDESLNGLGYQSLIYMMFCLMSFRQSWHTPAELSDAPASVEDESEGAGLGVAPIHLVLIEEPEAFLHAQVQQVFIKHALDVLRKKQNDPGHEGLHSQLVVSTHSSHIVQEVDFSSIRYIRRETANPENSHPLSTIVNLTDVFGEDSKTARFVRRYVELTHCNLFFADALIIVEGAAEKILLPEMLKSYPSIRVGYVELLQVRGSHAHRLRQLVEILGVPTLVITDIDAMELVPKEGETKKGEPFQDVPTKTRPKLRSKHVTGNPTLKDWLNKGKDLDILAKLADEHKVKHSDGGGSVRFAYQTPLIKNPQIIPSTFEDALAFANSTLLSELVSGSLVKKFAAIINEEEILDAQAERFYIEIRGGDKAEFALDLLTDIPPTDNLAVPEYISTGLSWLDSQLSKSGLFLPPQKPQAVAPEGNQTK